MAHLETLLDEGGKLTDAATLLSKDLLGVGGTDDDLNDHYKAVKSVPTFCVLASTA